VANPMVEDSHWDVKHNVTAKVSDSAQFCIPSHRAAQCTHCALGCETQHHCQGIIP